MNPTLVIVTAVGLCSVILIFVMIYSARYVKVGPNEALIVSGRQNEYRDEKGRKKTRGYRIRVGGGTFVWPVVEKSEILSLEPFQVVIGTHGGLEAVVQVKIESDDASVSRAAENFLSKSREEISALVGNVLEQYAGMTPDKAKEPAAADLARLGMTLVSYTIQE